MLSAAQSPQTHSSCIPRYEQSLGTPTVSNSSLVAQLVKNLPAMQETLVGLLGREDPLEKGMATHSSILA